MLPFGCQCEVSSWECVLDCCHFNKNVPGDTTASGQLPHKSSRSPGSVLFPSRVRHLVTESESDPDAGKNSAQWVSGLVILRPEGPALPFLLRCGAKRCFCPGQPPGYPDTACSWGWNRAADIPWIQVHSCRTALPLLERSGTHLSLALSLNARVLAFCTSPGKARALLIGIFISIYLWVDGVIILLSRCRAAASTKCIRIQQAPNCPVPAGDSLTKSSARFRVLCDYESASCTSIFSLNSTAAQTGRLLVGFSDGEIVAPGA